MTSTLRLVGFLFFICPLLTSCYSSRRLDIQQRIATLQTQVGAEDSLLQALDRKRMAKYNDQSIDDSISGRMAAKINGQKTDLLQKLQQMHVIDSLMDSRKSYRRQYKYVVLPELARLEEFVMDSAATVVRTDTYNMMDAMLDISRQNLFSMAAFFGSGEYLIQRDEMALIQSAFNPLFDSLIGFGNRYAHIPRRAMLTVYGFADGQPINPESALAADLLQRADLSTATPAELNKVLSAQRATEMGKVIQNMLFGRRNEWLNPQILRFTQVEKGLGEAFPNPNITDYTVDDERRRIVVFYWSVVPD